MMQFLQVCSRLRLTVPCLKTVRSFSSLQINNGSSTLRSQTWSVNRIFVRGRLIATRKQRNFRPQYVKDKISQDFELIYENNMNPWIFWGQICIYLTTVPSVVGSAWVVYDHIKDIPGNLTQTNPASTALLYIGFGTALLLFINLVSRRSIQRIYHNSLTGQYTAITSKWPGFPKKVDFALKDAKGVTPSISKLMIGNLEIKKTTYFVVGSDFKVPKHFNFFMGWEEDRKDDFHELDVVDFVRKPQKKLNSKEK